MSVLTVTNTVPDRTFTLHQAPLTNPPTRALPQLPQPLLSDLHSYTRSIAQKTQPGVANTHRHSRTISSSTLPNPSLPPPPPPVVPRSNKRHSHTPPSSNSPPFQSRPPSKPSSVGTLQTNNMQRQRTTDSNSDASIPRRSTSGRSVATNSPTSYVVLMRKQKATVWCDRAQNIDPRMAQQQKAAKQRAVNEAFGSNYARTASSISSSGVVQKIRHGAPKSGQYNSANMSGVVVPPRLLEFDLLGEEDTEGRVTGDNSMVHARTGSGKSSINSTIYRSGYPRAHASPPDGGSPAHEDIPEAGETPGVMDVQKENYFGADTRKMVHAQTYSDSEEDNFGELRDMTGPSAVQRAQEQQAKLEELRRRGSVDERTATMTGPTKLFVTNPDT